MEAGSSVLKAFCLGGLMRSKRMLLFVKRKRVMQAHAGMLRSTSGESKRPDCSGDFQGVDVCGDLFNVGKRSAQLGRAAASGRAGTCFLGVYVGPRDVQGHALSDTENFIYAFPAGRLLGLGP